MHVAVQQQTNAQMDEEKCKSSSWARRYEALPLSTRVASRNGAERAWRVSCAADGRLAKFAARKGYGGRVRVRSPVACDLDHLRQGFVTMSAVLVDNEGRAACSRVELMSHGKWCAVVHATVVVVAVVLTALKDFAGTMISSHRDSSVTLHSTRSVDRHRLLGRN